MAHALSQKRARPGLAAFVESLAEMADHTASLATLNDDEKKTLLFYRDQLGSSVEALTNIFASHDALQMGAKWNKPFDPHGPMLLHVALAAAFTIGSRAVENPIMKRIEQLAKKSRPLKATQAKLSYSKLIDGFIIELGEPIWKKRPTVADSQVATKIRDPLNEKLKEIKKIRDPLNEKPKQKVSLELDTVQRRVRKLRMNVRLSD